MILKLSALHAAAFAQCGQKREKTTLWISSTKNFFLIA